MIGVAKNHSVSRLLRMSLMSRKCTVSAASSRLRPSVNSNCTATTTGNHSTSTIVIVGRNHTRKASRIGSPKKKCIMFDSTATIGRISAGNSTFLIRLPPDIRLLAASVSEDENHVHGRMPQNMNSAYGSISGGWVPGSTTVKTNE